MVGGRVGGVGVGGGDGGDGVRSLGYRVIGAARYR